MDERLHDGEWVGGRRGKQVDKWIDGWVDGSIDG